MHDVVSSFFPTRKEWKESQKFLIFLSFTYWSNASSAITMFISVSSVFLLLSNIFCARHLARTMASSMEAEPPCATNGPVGCIASPAIVTVPFLKLLKSKSHGGLYFKSVRCKKLKLVFLIMSIASSGKPFNDSINDCLISTGSCQIFESAFHLCRMKQKQLKWDEEPL